MSKGNLSQINDIEDIKAIAISNGHKPGHMFSTNICFCNKCNAVLTFTDITDMTSYLSDENFGFKRVIRINGKKINGLYFSKCKGDENVRTN